MIEKDKIKSAYDLLNQLAGHSDKLSNAEFNALNDVALPLMMTVMTDSITVDCTRISMTSKEFAKLICDAFERGTAVSLEPEPVLKLAPKYWIDKQAYFECPECGHNVDRLRLTTYPVHFCEKCGSPLEVKCCSNCLNKDSLVCTMSNTVNKSAYKVCGGWKEKG